MAYLEVTNVNKAYGSVIALKNVGISVEKGEIRALLGGNGSGKSTLSKIIGGIVYKDSGTVILDGKEINSRSPREAIDNGIAVTSQELSLFPNLTLLEHLSLIKTPVKTGIFRDKKAIRSRALKALERVGLEKLIDERVEMISDSEKYLVELAKALLFEPKLLIVDEITSPLRRDEVDRVGRIIKRLSEDGITILFISHRLNEIFSYCDCVTVLRNGEVISTYRICDTDEEMLLHDMVGENVISHVDLSEMRKADKNQIVFNAENIRVPGFSGNSVSIKLHAGQVLGVAGLQGQGQAQLLRTLFGMDKPIDAEIKGKRVHIADCSHAIREGIGLVTGDRVNEGTFSGRSIKENLGVVNDLVINNKPLSIDETLNSYGVRYGASKHPIDSLSGGNQQKVIVARWTSTVPTLLLADDPTKGIDVAARADVHSIFNKLAQNGSAIIFVSSDHEELVTMASRTEEYSVVVMYNGEIVKELKGKDISTANIIAASVPTGKEMKP